jgi:hypothetical protein
MMNGEEVVVVVGCENFYKVLGIERTEVEM